jgi:subtilase family serine protease
LASGTLAASTPGTVGYGHYLTPAQYEQSYGPSAAQVQAVTDWLTAAGMEITATTSHYIAVQAPVARADAAFDTQISQYVTTSTTGKGGGTITSSVVGTAGKFSVPAALGADVAAVTGLGQTVPSSGSAATEKAVRNSAAERAEATPAVASAASGQAAGYQCSQY